MRSLQVELTNLKDEHERAQAVMTSANTTMDEMRTRLREQASSIGEKEVMAEEALADAEKARKEAHEALNASREAQVRATTAEGELERLRESEEASMKKVADFEMMYLQA